MDLARAINITAKDTHNVYVYGVSYGSYWAQRYLVLNPKQASKVVIDGVCPPDVCRMDSYDINTNIVGEDLMTLCGQLSKKCRSSLGDFPAEEMAFAMELTAADKLNCSRQLGLTTKWLRNLWGTQIISDLQRVLIPATVKRLLRCSHSDQEELKHLLAYTEAVARNNSRTNSSIVFNMLLGYNIALSESYSLVQPPHPYSYFVDLTDSLLVSNDMSLLTAKAYPLWPKYNASHTQGYNQYPRHAATKMLLLEGELDPETSHAWTLHAMSYYNQGQQFISVPFAPHGTVSNSPFLNSTLPCGMVMASSWLLHGVANSTCLSLLQPPDFEGSSAAVKQLSRTVFGTENLWGDDA